MKTEIIEISNASGSANGTAENGPACQVVPPCGMGAGRFYPSGQVKIIRYVAAFWGLYLLMIFWCRGVGEFFPFGYTEATAGWTVNAFGAQRIQLQIVFWLGVVGTLRMILADSPNAFDALLTSSACCLAAIGIYLLPYLLQASWFLPALLVGIILALVDAALSLKKALKVKAGATAMLFSVLTSLLFLLLSVGTVSMLFGPWAFPLFESSVSYPANEQDRRLAANIDSASSLFAREGWYEMDVQDKGQALVDMAIVSCDALGVRSVPDVKIGAFGGETRVSYDPNANTITLDVRGLSVSEGKWALYDIAYGCARAYQMECVDRGYALPADESLYSEVQPGSLAIEGWAREKDSLTRLDSSEDAAFEGESGAEAFASFMVCEVEDRVERYSETGDPYPPAAPAESQIPTLS